MRTFKQPPIPNLGPVSVIIQDDTLELPSDVTALTVFLFPAKDSGQNFRAYHNDDAVICFSTKASACLQCVQELPEADPEDLPILSSTLDFVIRGCQRDKLLQVDVRT
jgi:hypothetical protein